MNPRGGGESQIRWLLQRVEGRGVKAEPGKWRLHTCEEAGGKLNWPESPLQICNPRGLGMNPEHISSLKGLLSIPTLLHATYH